MFWWNLPVWQHRGADCNNTPWPAQGVPNKKWTGRWYRNVTGGCWRSMWPNSWFLPLPVHSYSSPAVGEPSRTVSRARNPRQPTRVCCSLGLSCCKQLKCCNDHTKGLPERSMIQSLLKKWKEKLGCMLTDTTEPQLNRRLFRYCISVII